MVPSHNTRTRSHWHIAYYCFVVVIVAIVIALRVQLLSYFVPACCLRERKFYSSIFFSVLVVVSVLREPFESHIITPYWLPLVVCVRLVFRLDVHYSTTTSTDTLAHSQPHTHTLSQRRRRRRIRTRCVFARASLTLYMCDCDCGD